MTCIIAVCTVLDSWWWTEELPETCTHMHNGSEYAVPSYTVNYTHAQRVRICCHNTELVHVNGHDRTIFFFNFSQALYKAPWWWTLCDPKHIGSTFKYFIILIVSTNHIFCISWIIKCLNTFKTFILFFFLRNNFYNNCNNICL